MVSINALSSLITALAVLLVWGVTPVVAEQQEDDDLATETVETFDINGSEDAEAVVEKPFVQPDVHGHFNASLTAGYRFFSTTDYGGRAARYEDIHSGAVVSGEAGFIGERNRFAVEGSYLSGDDYFGDITYDHNGAHRLHLRTESLYHNLDRLYSSIPNSFTLGTSIYQSDVTRDDSDYGIRAEQDLATLRIRLGTYPVHLNLQYWRMKKDGNTQLRFSDQNFQPVGATNTLYSASKKVDWETHEGKVGFDSHLGPINLAYDFTFRQFTNHSGTPLDSYSDRSGLTYSQPAGVYQHNDVPDSTYRAHSVKLHTDQTGGLVAAAVYSIAQRENNSSLSGVAGADGLTTTLQNAGGDLVYTPLRQFSLAVRFRHQEIDRETATLTSSYFLFNGLSTYTANQGIDTSRDIITAALSYRPFDSITAKGEYRGDFIHRDGTSSWEPVGTLSGVAIPSHTERHRWVLTLLSKPFKNLRLKTRYSYLTVNKPEYGNSPDKRHEGQILATYSLKDRFGLSANYQISRDNNDSSVITALNSTYDPVDLSRERKQVNATLSAWGTILDGRLSLTGTTGFIRSNTDQQTLFSSVSGPGSVTASNYTSQSFLYGVSLGIRPVEKLSTSLDYQQIRSFAEFDPTNRPYGAIGDMVGVKEISWLKTIENMFTFKGEYQFTDHFACGLKYLFREYIDRRDSQFNGAVHSVTTSLTAKW